MISIFLDSEDINSLVLLVSRLWIKELSMFRNFRLTDNNLLVFDFSFVTIHIQLTCDSSGKLLASIAKLTNSSLIDKSLFILKRIAPYLIQRFSKHCLVAEPESESTVSFKLENLAKLMNNMRKNGTDHDQSTEIMCQLIVFLSMAKIQNVFIQNNQLYLDVVLNGDEKVS